MSEVFVSVQQAGETLELSTVEVVDLCDDGELAFEFSGRRRRISKDSLDAYAARLAVESS